MTETTKPWHVLGCRGCGSAIVECALVLAGVSYTREEADYGTEAGLARLVQVNPLGQVPTLVMPDGSIMTESAAIVLHLDELYPKAGLLPPAGDPLRREALRWLVFLVANVYPTFTYGDHPEKFIGDAGPLLGEATHAYRQKLWKQLETVAKGPWFLGDTRSILDVYVSVMSRWRPRREWFASECPKLHEIALAVDKDPRLVPVLDANFR